MKYNRPEVAGPANVELQPPHSGLHGCIKPFQRVFHNAQFVVLTAVVDTAMSLRLKKEGVTCVMEKGISSNELVSSLRKVIETEVEIKTS